MLNKTQIRSKKSFSFNIRTSNDYAVCSKQNLVQQSINDDKAVADSIRKYDGERDITISTRTTSNISSHKNSVDESAGNRFRKQDHSKGIIREIRVTSTDINILLGRADSLVDGTLHRNLFNYKAALGKGGFGKVWKV
jgi:hypothetical protein